MSGCSYVELAEKKLIEKLEVIERKIALGDFKFNELIEAVSLLVPTVRILTKKTGELRAALEEAKRL